MWRTIINGYPYKSLSELGVANEEEAFTATKHAVYCYLFENTPDDYEAIGEAGERTLNALKKIVLDSMNSQEAPSSENITVNAISDGWIEDEDNSNYISKIYTLNSKIDNLEYEIINLKDLPEGSKITNLDGKEKLSFNKDEKFKVMLLKDKLDNDGEFELNIKTQVKTKPVLYGKSPDASWQNYAITTYMYEDEECILKDTYKKIEKPKEEPKKTEKEEKIEEVKILPVTGM